VVQSPLVNPFDSEEEEVAPPATIKPKKKTQFAAATTSTSTTIATDPFPDEDEGQTHSSGTNPSHHDGQGPVSSNVTKATLRPCKSMAVNYNVAKGGNPESKLTKHMSLSSSAYTPFGKATSPAVTTTTSSGEAPHFPRVSHHKSMFAISDSWHLFGHKNTAGDHVGTRRKEVMGAEDAGTKTSRDVFGHDDADSDECDDCRGKKAVFGSEDVGYETGKNGRNLVGDEDKDGVVNSSSREVFGSGGDEGGPKSRKAGEVFGDYDGEEEDDDEYAPMAPSVDEFVNKAVADLRGLTLTQAITTTLVTKTVEVTEAK